MKKIAVASIQQETCHFYNVKTPLQDFKDNYFKLGADVVNLPAHEWEIGGFAAAMKSKDVQLVGIISARTGAGGEVAAEAYAYLRDTLLAGLKKEGPFDAVFLALHGAIAAEGEPDVCGAITAAVRKLVGKDCFIDVLLDHHGNVTDQMFKAADLIQAYKTQPHDFAGSGAEAARLLVDVLERKRKPHGAFAKIPMLSPQDNFLTAGGPMKEWFDLSREIEKDPAVIVVANLPTQPWMDVPHNGWSCLVYADSAEKAQAYVKQIAQRGWALRKEFWKSGRLSLADTIAAANAEPKGLVVISDTGDTIWGGAPGDNVGLLAEMLKQGVNGPALVPVVDPEAQKLALKAGIGQRVTLRLGGKMSAGYSPTVEVTGRVAAFAEPGVREFENGMKCTVGPSVLFEAGHLKIVILELRDFAVNHPIMYEKLGLDVSKAKLVVLKTAGNFQFFAKYQSRLIRADSSGATQSDLTTLPFKHLTHPMYPFDDLKEWTP